MGEMASLLLPGIRFTTDLPSRYQSGKVPMLDLQVWIERSGPGTIIRHTYYEKQVTSPLVFHNRGACPTRQKIVVLAEEAKRRLYNQDRQHSPEDRMKDLQHFTQKLIDSDYGKETRREILKAGVKRFYRLLLQEAAGGRAVYRSLEDMLPQRRIKQLKTKTWFQPARGGSKISTSKDHPQAYRQQNKKGYTNRWNIGQPERSDGRPSPPPTKEKQESKVKVLESPIFIPFTKDSTLRKALQVVDDTLGECMNTPGVRFVERCGGQTIGELLGNSNPWSKALRCERQGCLQCKSRDMLLLEETERPIPEPGQPVIPRPAREDMIALPKCTTEGIGYVMECWLCRLQGQNFRYIGESSRSGNQRAGEHLAEIHARKKTHPMVQHHQEHHSGQPQEVLFRVVQKFKTALERQVWESVTIDSTNASLGHKRCLNNKTEWGSSKDPALVHKRSPPSKGTATAQTTNQVAGNTLKRSGTGPPDLHPSKRARGEVIEVTSPAQSTEGDSPRSRWDRWKESQQPPGQSSRQTPETKNMPTESGLLGSSALVHTPPSQGREGPGLRRSTRTRLPGGRDRPPEQDVRSRQNYPEGTTRPK